MWERVRVKYIDTLPLLIVINCSNNIFHLNLYIHFSGSYNGICVREFFKSDTDFDKVYRFLSLWFKVLCKQCRYTGVSFLLVLFLVSEIYGHKRDRTNIYTRVNEVDGSCIREGPSVRCSHTSNQNK